MTSHQRKYGLEGVQGKYLKWVLRVDRETPGYIVMEETKRDGIRIEAGKRAIRFEESVIERGECRILQECLKEKRKEIGKGVWKEREAYFERNGYAGAEIERMREGGRAMTDELVQRDRDVQVQEIRMRIRESRYNGKMCGEKKETIEHLLNECVELRERDESREEMLNEDGRGIEWMKKQPGPAVGNGTRKKQKGRIGETTETGAKWGQAAGERIKMLLLRFLLKRFRCLNLVNCRSCRESLEEGTREEVQERASEVSARRVYDGPSIKFANFLHRRAWPECLHNRSSAIDSLRWSDIGGRCGLPAVLPGLYDVFALARTPQSSPVIRLLFIHFVCTSPSTITPLAAASRDGSCTVDSSDEKSAENPARINSSDEVEESNACDEKEARRGSFMSGCIDVGARRTWSARWKSCRRRPCSALYRSLRHARRAHPSERALPPPASAVRAVLRFSCERTPQTVALAPTPVLVGYSLVGVYPCAVWKPRRATSPCTASTGPVRTRVAGPARNQPYPTHHCQGHQDSSTTNTAAARVQPPQLLVTACSCNNNNTAELQVATNNTPMVFVPFSMPSYAPPMAAGALYTNNCSPSKIIALNCNSAFVEIARCVSCSTTYKLEARDCSQRGVLQERPRPYVPIFSLTRHAENPKQHTQENTTHFSLFASIEKSRAKFFFI
ncbi:hypothetical protein GEV33_001545 [Tenebrio molitor]|uniref:Uncharacterized protein n=1 Tax=Tenebrio molitor TaxID=7067 RepID=A0A8J6HWT9_TENMO|nr:hypothetical protein GEV33_001545 [Tenebrio molitor]